MSRAAGVYLRISLDPNGTRLGVTRQQRDCLAKAKTLGWRVHEVYEDNDVSASGTKPRPAYQRMLADLEAGTINAVIVWDLDRLTRRPIEIEHFIDLADRKRIALASVGGDVDLGTDNGRLFARIKGAVARAEIERKSARQRAANAQRAEAGRPHVGRRAFGYSPDGLTVREDEAAHIRDAATRLLAGQSVNSIAAHLNAAGARTTAGNPWGSTEVRRLLRNPRYASLRVHQGSVIGPGQWPSILDDDTHATIRSILDDPARHSPGRPQASLLTSIATCGPCGQVVYATRSGARVRHYYCRTRRHVTRQADPIDDYVSAVVVALAVKHGPMLLEQRSPDPGRIAHLRGRETELRARLDGLAQAYAAGAIDDLQLRAGSKRARGELESVSKELVGLSRSTPLARIVQAGDPTSEWEAMGMDLQRLLVQEVATVRLLPPGRGARVFRPETIDVKLGGGD